MRMITDLSKILSPKQLQCYRQANGRINIAHGSVRAGKSVALEQYRWPAFVLNETSDKTLFMVARTLKTLERNVLLPLQELYGPGLCKYSLGSKTAFLFGRRIELEGANDAQARSKLIGSTVSGALLNEINLLPEDFVKEMLARMDSDSAKMFATCNPDSPYHYLKKEYLDRESELRSAGSDLRQWHFTLDDNTKIDDEYKTALKAEYGPPSSIWYKRSILGLWVLAAGAVYDMWDNGIHVVKHAGEWKKYAVAVDYGTSNPCTFGLYGWNGSSPPAMLVNEYWYDGREENKQKTDSAYADDMIKWLGPFVDKVEKIYVDPSAASFIAELKGRKLPVRKAKNDVLNGIRLVSRLLGDGLYSVHQSCKKTIENYQAYVWDKKAQQRGEDKPLKENDHACDRDRYFLMSEFGRNNVISGGRIMGARR